MSKYTITITEIYQKEFEVNTEQIDEVCQCIEELYEDGIITLNDNDLIDSMVNVCDEDTNELFEDQINLKDRA